MTVRRGRPVAVLAVIVASLAGAASASAATDMFMIVTGVKGESNDGQYKDTSPLKSLDLGFGQGQGSARPVFDPVVVTKNVDSTTPFMFRHVGTASHIAGIRIVVRSRGATPHPFLQYCLENVLVTDDHVSNSPASVLPEEKVSFDPDKLEIRYTATKADGTSEPPVLAGWNIVSDTSIGFNNSCAGFPS